MSIKDILIKLDKKSGYRIPPSILMETEAEIKKIIDELPLREINCRFCNYDNKCAGAVCINDIRKKLKNDE